MTSGHQWRKRWHCDNSQVSMNGFTWYFAMTFSPSGQTGSTGPAGLPGSAGAKGQTGATGQAGSVGATGLTGSIGTKGDIGSTGSAGPTGATGISGLPGATGVSGSTGPPGAMGTVGATGRDGAKGSTGRNPLPNNKYIAGLVRECIISSAIAMEILQSCTKLSTLCYCPACRTTLVATRFRVAVICPIIQVPHCIRVFFYFVWFVFINHIFQFYYELCTYCNILDIYLS